MTQATRPASIETLAEYLGDSAAARICMALGGSDIKVPKGQDGKTWLLLVELLGPETAADMVECFGGESIYIARNAAEERLRRGELMIKLLDSGKTHGEVARSLEFTSRYSERGVRKLAAAVRALHGLPAATAQAALSFDAPSLPPMPPAPRPLKQPHPLHAAWGAMAVGAD